MSNKNMPLHGSVFLFSKEKFHTYVKHLSLCLCPILIKKLVRNIKFTNNYDGRRVRFEAYQLATVINSCICRPTWR